jgi:hypothetical protein
LNNYTLPAAAQSELMVNSIEEIAKEVKGQTEIVMKEK